MDDECEVREYVRRYLRYGFYNKGEIAEIVGDDVFAGAIARTRLRKMITEEAELLRAEQQSWPPITDCDRLDNAFVSLNATGVLALHNAGLTPSEGIAEMSDRYHEFGGETSGIVGYCFYYRQSMEDVLKTGELYLAFGDIHGDKVNGVEIGRRVRRELEEAGLNVDWTGSINDCLVLKRFKWQRRARRT